MRAAALVLALALPSPVTSVGAVPNSDGSVTIFWTLPVDPTVVGVTVIRERLDLLEPNVQFVLGLDTSLTDFSTVVTGDYRYWVYTRNANGDLSTGAFAEVFSGSGTFVGTSSSVVCFASASPGLSALPLVLTLALAALAMRR